MLSPYRALDLSDERGVLCGRVLADLGMDVIKVEPLGGDPSRFLEPFYHGDRDPEKSLFWFAYNTNKRSVTLNLESSRGKDLFRRLVATTDIVIESYPVGYLESIGLGYSDLAAINPGVILVSITGFGQTGPYANFKAPDIVAMAMGGEMYLSGDTDRAPIRLSFDQAYFHASLQGAMGALVALHGRHQIGVGQHVDVSAQAATFFVTQGAPAWWDLNQEIIKRAGPFQDLFGSPRGMRIVWECLDGFVAFRIMGGAFGAKGNYALADWIAADVPNTFLREINWDALDLSQITLAEIDDIEEEVGQFFLRRTKEELVEAAIRLGIALFPVSTMEDLLANEQLQARNFWVPVEHAELGSSILYPGAFATFSETPFEVRRRPPLIGEHNEEIYRTELGLSVEELDELKAEESI